MPSNRKSPGLLLRNAGIFNPVLVQAVGLCPVIAMATSLRGAAMLAGIAAVVITISELIASLLFKAIPRWVRIGLYIIIGGALILPFMMLLEKTDAELFGSLGIYLPIMAVNSLIVLRCERFAVKISPLSALLDGLTASVGYSAVLIFTGLIREILGSGSIAGFKFWKGPTLSGLLLPFGGFLMIGYAAAALRAFISIYWPKYLDKKQPKPKDKKKPSKKKTRPLPSTAASAPDLEADDSPFTLEEIYADETPHIEHFTAKPKQTKPTEHKRAQTTPQAETVIENPVEEVAHEVTPEPEKEKPAQTETAVEITPIDDLTYDEVESDVEAPAKPEQKQRSATEVDDEELDKLMNRSTDDVIGKKEKEDISK